MKKLNFGIFGVAHHHSRSFTSTIMRHPSARIVGVYDRDRNLAREFAKNFDLQAFFDLKDILQGEELDVGVVTSENASKKELAIELANAGKHILCDKPLGLNSKESEDIIRACSDAGVKLQVGYLSRYTMETLETKRIIQANRIGKIKFLQGENRVDVGSVKILSPWLAKSSATGGRGALLEHSVHLADLIQWYVGQAPASVYAVKGRNLDTSFEVEDNFALLVTFPDGVVATIDGSYCKPSSGRTDDLVLKIVGTKGEIKILIQKKALTIRTREEPTVNHELLETELSGRYEGIAAWNMIDDLIDSIHYNRIPLTCGEDAKAVNELVESSYKSLETGNEVRIR